MITIPGRIPIFIHPIFWFLIFFIGLINSTGLGILLWAVIVFISVLIHEYGHALTALAFGQKAEIHLVGLGGLTQREGSKLALWKDFIVVLNGPLAGLLLGSAAYLLATTLDGHLHSHLEYALWITFYANMVWTVMNLLPIYPLDGGHLLRIILEASFGIRGIKTSFFISCIFAILLGILFFTEQEMVLGAILLLLAFESYRAWKGSLGMTYQDQDTKLQNILQEAEADLKNGNLDLATDKLQAIRSTTKQGMLYITATEHLASILTRQGNHQEALAMLTNLEDNLSSDALLLLHQLAFNNKDWQLAITTGDRAYQAEPNCNTALINALAYAMLKDETPAIGWFQRSVEDGLSNPKEALKKQEFDAIRNREPFQELARKYR